MLAEMEDEDQRVQAAVVQEVSEKGNPGATRSDAQRTIAVRGATKEKTESTDKSSGDASRFQCLGRMGFDSIRIIPSMGQSGGLVAAWNSSRISVSSISDPWSVIRDFNDILTANEQSGGRGGSIGRMQWFQDRINECRLVDLGAIGPRMTWKGPRIAGCSRLYERLDRALSNSSFIKQFPDSYVKVLPRTEFSDHNPPCGKTKGSPFG
ncbi:hypothetical protein K1719_039231 [Acacia pycnantha]|nr:hypothetical protein K1719_039231 [Acacia pycnantha]